jgi:hypothetical protein
MSGITSDQIVDLLFKKLLNTGNTNPVTSGNQIGNYLIEPIRQNFINTQHTNIYSQVIPVPAPADLILVEQSNGYSKYISSNYPYISYFSTVKLVSATFCNNVSFLSPLLQNIITPSYDLTYLYKIFANSSNDIASTRDSQNYYVDPDIGILTFFNPSVNNFNSGNRPSISFYRYEGQKGDSQFLNIQQL